MGHDIGPNLNKRQYDVWLAAGDSRYRVELKTIIDLDDYNKLEPVWAAFGSFLLDNRSATRLHNAVRKATRQVSKAQNPVVAIDISLYHDGVIPLLAGLGTNSLEKSGLITQIKNLKHHKEMPLFLILRDPYTALVGRCLTV